MTGEVRSATFCKVGCERSRYSVGEVDAVDAVCAQIDAEARALCDSAGLFAPGAKRQAFVTFATPEYSWGLLVLLRSLRKVSDRPVIVLASREMAVPQGVAGVVVLAVPGLYNEDYSFGRVEFSHVLAKLWMFALTSLDRVFFVDADCMFLKSADELFERADFCVCPDYVEDRKSEAFNSGVLAFTPGEALRSRVFAQVGVVPSDDGGDQGALNGILRDDVTFVAEKYNLLRHFHYFSGPEAGADTRIVHFIVKKPWELQYRETPDAMLTDLDDAWTSFLEPAERLQLIAHWRRSIFHVSERARIENAGPRALDPLAARIAALEHRLGAQRQGWLRAAALLLAMLAGAAFAHFFWR